MTIDDLNPVECTGCEGIGEIINHEADVESELAVNFGNHTLKKEWWIECPSCNGIGKDQRVSELLSNQIDLLLGAIELYHFYPNNFRKSGEEYFRSDIKFLETFTGQRWEDIQEVKID